MAESKLIQVFMDCAARMRKIHSKIKALEWSQQTSHCKSICRFSRHSRAVNSTVLYWFCLKFKPIQAFMYVLVTCKNEEDPFKNEGARVVTALSFNV